jgi:hypothetical protein
MTTPAGSAWDLAGRLLLRVHALDVTQAGAVEAALDPFRPGVITAQVDVLVTGGHRADRSDIVEVQGPARDGTTTARDRDGHLLALYGGRWATVPVVQGAAAGGALEIAVEAGLHLPSCWADLVRPVLHHGLHRRGNVAVHGTAVENDSGAVLVAGWSETGKTEVGLALVERGARFLSDKWTVAGTDGVVTAFPVPVGVRGWALDALPVLRSSLPIPARSRLAASGALKHVTEDLGHGRAPAGAAGRAVRSLRRAAELGDRISVRPSEVRQAYGDTSDPGRHVPLRTVIVLTTSSADTVAVEEVDAAWAARRLARSAAYERRAFFDLQERAAYAGLPDRAGAREASRELDEHLLLQALRKAQTVLRVACPFPADPRRVVDALAALPPPR